MVKDNDTFLADLEADSPIVGIIGFHKDMVMKDIVHLDLSSA